MKNNSYKTEWNSHTILRPGLPFDTFAAPQLVLWVSNHRHTRVWSPHDPHSTTGFLSNKQDTRLQAQNKKISQQSVNKTHKTALPIYQTLQWLLSITALPHNSTTMPLSHRRDSSRSLHHTGHIQAPCSNNGSCKQKPNHGQDSIALSSFRGWNKEITFDSILCTQKLQSIRPSPEPSPLKWASTTNLVAQHYTSVHDSPTPTLSNQRQ